MTGLRHPTRLAQDARGAVAIEFAILAPALILMLMGVLMVGLYMKSYNAVRSLAYDVNRYTVVEYQKNNKMDGSQIEQVTLALARNAPYDLSVDGIDATAVADADFAIANAKKFVLTLNYTPPALTGLFGWEPPTIKQTQSIIVPE